jgi:enoyl-CoA hydratase/carnithine racemase
VVLTGRPFSAAEGAAWGLVNKVCKGEELMSVALETASAIAANAPISVKQAKQSIQRGLDMSIWDGLSFEIEAYNRMVPTADRREGVLAYNERRKPRFRGE